jgi:hypothetical protein
MAKELRGLYYLLGGVELERTESTLEVSDGGLEIVQSLGNVGLQLRGLGVGRGVGGDLDKGGHLDFFGVLKLFCWMGQKMP